MSEQTYQVELTRAELIAVARWHTDPDRDNDMPPHGFYADHVKRAAELLANLTNQEE